MVHDELLCKADACNLNVLQFHTHRQCHVSWRNG